MKLLLQFLNYVLMLFSLKLISLCSSFIIEILLPFFGTFSVFRVFKSTHVLSLRMVTSCSSSHFLFFSFHLNVTFYSRLAISFLPFTFKLECEGCSKNWKIWNKKICWCFFQIGTTNISKSVLNLKYLLKITVLLNIF